MKATVKSMGISSSNNRVHVEFEIVEGQPKAVTFWKTYDSWPSFRMGDEVDV